MSRSDGGFTLLELLVALTVLGVLMVLMFGGLRFGARVWESGDASLRAMAEMQTAAGLIRRQISQAMPTAADGAAMGGLNDLSGMSDLRGSGGGSGNGAGDGAGDGVNGGLTPPFRGNPEALRLIGPAPSQLLPGGLYETIIGVEDGVGGARGGRRLSIWWRPLPHAGEGPALSLDADARTRQAVLIDGIAEFRLSYFGQGGDVNEPPQWHDRWETMLSLPSLVSVQMAFMPGDRRSWPQLVVAPMASPPY